MADHRDTVTRRDMSGTRPGAEAGRTTSLSRDVSRTSRPARPVEKKKGRKPTDAKVRRALDLLHKP